MKRRTRGLLALCLVLALPGLTAAWAEPVILEEMIPEEMTMPEESSDGLPLPVDALEPPAIDAEPDGDVPGAAPNETVNSGKCGENVQWTLDSDGLLTISGSGEMDSYFSFWEVTWGANLRRAVVMEGVTSIAMNTFNGCDELESVSLPDSVQNIYANAFMACPKLTRVDIPYGVPYVAGYCFARCCNLSVVTIPESVTEIVDHAFDDCTRLTIHGYDGSYAEVYASENGIPFVSLGAAPTRPEPRLDLSDCGITVKNQVYSGKAKKPAVTVTLDGSKLSKGVDYTVSFGNNKAIGTANVTVKGKGRYTGTASATFRIDPKAVSGLKLTAGKGSLTASWSKGVGGVSGYQLQYGLKSSFSGAKKATVSKAATVKRVLKGLKAGRTWYVRIRAFKKVSGKTYWSAWSAAKKAKVK